MSLAVGVLMLMLAGAPALAEEPVVRCEVEIDAPIDRVWHAWTTRAGMQTFFAPDGRVDLRPFGAYEVYFMPAAEPGQRGAEDCVVLAFEEPCMLAFTWSPPPQWPELRKQRTSVVVRLREVSPGRTRVTITHTGFGESPEWGDVREYFANAWGNVVLPLLKHSLEVAPVDWTNLKRDLDLARAAMK